MDSLGMNIPLEIETMGDVGLRYKARFLKHSKWKKLPGIPAANLIDAAGSGDWLSAGLAHMLHNIESLEHLTTERLEYALNFGQALASLNCGYAGARGMMYRMSRSELFEVVADKLGNAEMPMRAARPGPRPGLTSKLDAWCRACLCSG